MAAAVEMPHESGGIQQQQQQQQSAASLVRRETRRRAAERVGAMTMRRPRTSFSADQLSALRRCFAESPYIDVHQRVEIAAALQLTDTQAATFLLNIIVVESGRV